MSPPRFIVLEGIDGSGTSTQCRRVGAWLRERGHRVHETREPSTGKIGSLTREFLAVRDDVAPLGSAALALLFAADRLEHVAREIEPILADDGVVLCDRYVMSSWVYQSLSCDPAWVRTINREARWPDLSFVFDIRAEVAAARVIARRAASGEPVEIFDVPETQRRLAAGYRALLDDPELAGLVRVDAERAIDAVTAQIVERCRAAGL